MKSRKVSSPRSSDTKSKDEVAAEMVTLDKIHPWPKNLKFKPIEPKDVRELSRSIKRFGFGDPIVARKANGEIIAGHLRYFAAKRLKIDQVPVRFLDLSEDEAHAMAIAETKLERMRNFDKGGLAVELDALEEKGVDLEYGTGFDSEDIENLLDKDDSLEDLLKETDNAPSITGGLYSVIVECKSDAEQRKLLDRLEGEGFECRALVQ